MNHKIINPVWLGTIAYQEGLRLQAEYQHKTMHEHESFLLGLEHKPVITLGKRVKDARSEILSPPDGYEVEFTDRGGEATIHSPGQLVVYPILPLRELQLSVRDYVAGLETSLISTLKTYDLRAETHEGDTGVFTTNGKIGFIGIRVSNGISSHGLSLNVKNDLEVFQKIRACGKLNRPLDSLLNHKIDATPQDVFKKFIAVFAQVFGLTFLGE